MTTVKATVLAIEGPAEGTNEYRLMFETIVEGFGLMLVGLAVSGTDIQDQDIRQGDTVVLEHNPRDDDHGVYVRTVDMAARPSTSMPTIIEEPEPDDELVFVVRAMIPPGADLPAATEKMERALQQVMGPLVENTEWHGWSVQARGCPPTWAEIERAVDA